MRYVQARNKKEYRELAYRIYVTDALKSLTGGEQRYWDLVYTPKAETRTPEEIKSNILKKLSGGR